ncbi:MAG: alpha-glucuronidase [Treponema sp.]|jgi:alpha-glucuronidase|nr:alpha-glucuronidase [Treponema sp.]
MNNEYNCWLQERKSQAAIALLPLLNTIFAEEGALPGGGEVAVQAVEEFRRGIKRLLGFSPSVHFSQSAQAGGCGVFLGTVSRLEKIFSLSGQKQAAGGFTIRFRDKQLVIAGQDEPGLLYGVFRFLALLAMDLVHDGLEISDAPVSPLRMINHWDNLDGTIERGYAGPSLFYRNGRFDYDRQRIEDYARLLASVGINRISINNVNVRDEAKLLITEEYLGDVAALAAVFRRFGIKLFLSINFGAPWSLGKLPSADPLAPDVAAWWKERAALIYKYIPDLAGFLVKADSEGEPGPFLYNRTHADGANMLAQAVGPHGGEIIWRCFVYNCQQDWRDHSFDRARAAYDHFMPLDGAFNDNVILQIKFGPYDFQVREPVTPLFGSFSKTRHVMELQITQEYTGHQIDLCYLPWFWEDLMCFDTAQGPASRISELVGPYSGGHSFIEGFAAVVNVGLDRNWTGHTLAQANLYGYGRIAWNPNLTATEIAREWSVLSFGTGPAAERIAAILLKSYPAYEKYNAPFGVCFMVTPGLHYGPNIEGYEYSRWGTYHRADAKAIGIDRTPSGTGYTSQYSAKNAAMFADPASCPENLILFFHRLRYDYKMKNGETLLQNIYDTHFEGYEEAAAMLEQWKSLKDSLEEEVYQAVLSRFERQLANAREWRDQINTYFFRKTGIADKRGRKIYD